MSFTLRPYQNDIVSAVRGEFKKKNRRVLVTAPTGSGKTVLIAHMMAEAETRGISSWMIVHRKELVEQTVEALEQCGVNPNVVAAGRDRWGRGLVSVCSVQTLSRRQGKYTPPGMVIWDECHHQAAATYQRVYDTVPDAWHVGLTATPVRLDGKGLSSWYDVMVVGPSTHELIRAGYLSDYRMFVPSAPDLSSCKVRMGDWTTSSLTDAMDKPSVTGCAIEQYLDKCSGMQAIVFAASVKHSESVSAQFNSAGIESVHLDGGTHERERARGVARFREGDLQVLCNVGLFGEGFDVPGVECAILLRPTKSLGVYLQQVGRALRKGTKAGAAIILDHSGNARVHGLPDDDREWSLRGRADRVRGATESCNGARVCPVCFGASPAGAVRCAACDFEFKPEPRTLKQAEGDLCEVDKEAERKKRRAGQGSCKTVADLVAEGKRRGYKNPGWWAKCVMGGRSRRA